MANVVLVDKRTPVEPTEPTPIAERIPLGAFVAYNGPSDDGERKRAIVIGYGENNDVLELLNGPEKVVVDDPEQLASVIILAKSADAYANRVSVKARALGRAHDWCEVANNAITELNQTPEQDTNGMLPDPLKVRLTITRDIIARVRRNRHTVITPANVLDHLQRSVYANAELNYDLFSHDIGTTDTQVMVEVVDEFTTTNGDAPETTSSRRARRS